MSQLKAAIANAHTAAEIEAMEDMRAAIDRCDAKMPVLMQGPGFSYVIGKMVEGEGLFAGVWQPLAHMEFIGLCEPAELEKAWLVFAAPTDLAGENGQPRIRTFPSAAREINERQRLGHHGLLCLKESDLHSALIDKTYNGEWFIPPLGLLCGKDAEGRVVEQESLFKNRLKGDFAFKMQNGQGVESAYYWSCTPVLSEKDKMNAVDFSSGEVRPHFMTGIAMNCRAVRLKEIAPG
jgi:hypothetical protein